VHRPAVSVLMAVHNGMPWLRETLDSLLAQTFADFELVVVDDGSTDETSEVLARCAAREGRVRVITNASKQTLPVSLNVGLEGCAAPWVARADADDVYLPHRLAAQMQFVSEHPEIGVCGADCDHIDEHGRVVGETRHAHTDEFIRFVMPFRNQIHHPIALFNKRLVQSLGGYDARLWTGQDYDLWARLLPFTLFANIPEKLWRYRMHGGAITQSPARKKHHEELMLPVRQSLFARYLDRTVTPQEARALHGLGTSSRVLEAGEIDLGIKLCGEYLKACCRRESEEVVAAFRCSLADALLGQAAFQRRASLSVRRELVRAAASVHRAALIRKPGLRAVASLVIPTAAFDLVDQYRSAKRQP
jgi:hypothetical protein